jgi:hypothetical protein
MLEFVKVLGLFAINGAGRDSRLLSALVGADPAAFSLALDSCRRFLGPVCLATDLASGRSRANLRCLRGCLRGDCPDLAMADRWRCADPMGSCWQCGRIGRYGDHNAPTGSVPFERQDAKMKIGELARLAGTNVETIRYYERDGLLPIPSPKRRKLPHLWGSPCPATVFYSALSRSGHDAG